MKTYCGIGSRSTPGDIQSLMVKIAHRLAALGYTLRSGGADGADKAFEMGAAAAGGEREIRLPWKGFNGNDSELYEPTKEAMAIACQYHPGFSNLSDAVRKLMARNVHQVLGWDCATPSDFIVCWTPDGADGWDVKTTSKTGGTGMAIRVAHGWDVPVVNMQRDGWREKLKGLVRA